MNKIQFLNNSDVLKFANWFQRKYRNIEFNLNIRKSKFVPTPIFKQIKGLENLLSCYQWKSADMLYGNWHEASAYILNLSEKVKIAVDSGNDNDALLACYNILRWGGDRNPRVGACPFLTKKAHKNQLCDYILAVSKTLNLETADTDNLKVEMMNSMLTKVHALYAKNELPIYDSRVSAAIATLVEMWRNDEELSDTPIPDSLCFPATAYNRTVHQRYPNAQFDSGLVGYGQFSSLKWTSAKVRLGWILEYILNNNHDLFSGQNRMHAFEACLFMIGYDVNCLSRT